MTAQISDTFIYKGEDYSMIGSTAGKLVTPEDFGMKADMLHTACYAGYYSTFELTDEELILKKMTINVVGGDALPIDGIMPEGEGSEGGPRQYKGLKYKVGFTGRIRLAKDFIDDYYIHMGYQKPTAFKTVYDITLENGRVVKMKDRSDDMEKKRGEFKKYYESGNLAKTIEDAFSLDMEIE